MPLFRLLSQLLQSVYTLQEIIADIEEVSTETEADKNIVHRSSAQKAFNDLLTDYRSGRYLATSHRRV